MSTRSIKLFYANNGLVSKSELWEYDMDAKKELLSAVIQHKYANNTVSGYDYFKVEKNNPTPVLSQEVSVVRDNKGFITQCVIKNSPDTVFWLTNAEGAITGYYQKNVPGGDEWLYSPDGNVAYKPWSSNFPPEYIAGKAAIKYNDKPNVLQQQGIAQVLFISYRNKMHGPAIAFSKNQITEGVYDQTVTTPSGDPVRANKSTYKYTYEYEAGNLLKAMNLDLTTETWTKGVLTNTTKNNYTFKYTWGTD
ncbi:hypothetical protein HHL16_01295 [Pseudoflavitalea sp. G-6-1-2]|uniref:hypothetical protein n=1 Tax=Pseudoflavitalea sp. G-6-1-2 TaxID=2728841 RepID=UPI00146F0C6D|nr:hypothetical protein [Pseudoflavitalea sp. G-6-1-2]NML19483.1 hypothetical protein [Pseudoflavitalea sp. G-6-1-2]